MGKPLRLLFMFVGVFALGIGLLAWGAFVGWSVTSPPAVIAERHDANGAVIEQLVRMESHKQVYMPVGPCGGRGYPTHFNCQYFVQTPGKPLPAKPAKTATAEFMYQIEFGEAWRPVGNSRRWVMAGFDNDSSRTSNSLIVEVFDDTGPCAMRKLPIGNDFSDLRDLMSMEEENRKVVYRTANGFNAYDVMTDTVSPWQKH